MHCSQVGKITIRDKPKRIAGTWGAIAYSRNLSFALTRGRQEPRSRRKKGFKSPEPEERVSPAIVVGTRTPHRGREKARHNGGQATREQYREERMFAQIIVPRNQAWPVDGSHWGGRPWGYFGGLGSTKTEGSRDAVKGGRNRRAARGKRQGGRSSFPQVENRQGGEKRHRGRPRSRGNEQDRKNSRGARSKKIDDPPEQKISKTNNVEFWSEGEGS